MLLKLYLQLVVIASALLCIYHAKRSRQDHPVESDAVPFILVICTENGGNRVSQVSRTEMQLRQVEVHLKSAVALTSRKLMYILICDKYSTFKIITTQVLLWPAIYRSRIHLQYRQLYLPTHGSSILSLYEKCATEKLFLHWALPDLDAGIFLDTDTFFMRPPEDLADLLQNFDHKHFLGAAPVDGFYKQRGTEIQYYGQQGLSSSLLLLNFTRWRQLPFDWYSAVDGVYRNFRYLLRTGDQDIFNLIFSNYPEYVFDFGCDWGGMIEQCATDWHCSRVKETGFSMVHGARWRFFNDYMPTLVVPMRVMFRAWEEHQLGTPVAALLSDMMSVVIHFEEEIKQWTKGNLTNIICPYPVNNLFKQLQNYVNNIQTKY